jgi:cysteine desulfurase
MNKQVYVDNAATTRVSRHVLDAMLPYLGEHYGNPSSIYRLGGVTRAAIVNARGQVASALGADPGEVFFTSCGTEADNWAIKGAAARLARLEGKKHIITTVFEHHAVLHTCQHLEKEGFEVTYLPVDGEGLVSPDSLREAIRPDTAIVSIMYANNEIGTIQPIAELGAVCREAGVLFHTDAVQAVGSLRIDVTAENIDLLSLSGHKLHAPKGVGALYMRKGVTLDTLMDGGAQERGRRAGTENTACIVALGAAVEDAYRRLEERVGLQRRLRDLVLGEALKIERARLNGSREHRLPGNLNISVEGIEGEALLLRLDNAGISASSGSACTSGSLDPSHVLLAIGLPHEIAHGSLRMTFGDDNTEEEARYICGQLPGIVETLRNMSPVWEKIVKNG